MIFPLKHKHPLILWKFQLFCSLFQGETKIWLNLAFLWFLMFWTYLTPQITFLSKTLEANQFVLLRAFRRVPIYIFDFLKVKYVSPNLYPLKSYYRLVFFVGKTEMRLKFNISGFLTCFWHIWHIKILFWAKRLRRIISFCWELSIEYLFIFLTFWSKYHLYPIHATLF